MGLASNLMNVSCRGTMSARQQYHGGAFVGNHVHRILQNVDDLVYASRLIIASHFSDECSISAQADTLAFRYRYLFSQFSVCRKIDMSSSLISEEQLDQLSAQTPPPSWLLSGGKLPQGSWVILSPSSIFLRSIRLSKLVILVAG